MNTGNAFAFCLSGLGMWVLPQVAPEFFARHAIDGSSTRALWLQVMACVHVAVGAVYLFRSGLLPWLAAGFSRATTARPALAPVTVRSVGSAVPTLATFPAARGASVGHHGGLAAIRSWPATLRRASVQGHGRMVLSLQGARQWPRRLAAGGDALTQEPQLVRASSLA